MMEQRMLPNRFELISVRTYTAGESPLNALSALLTVSDGRSPQKEAYAPLVRNLPFLPNRNRWCDVSYCCRCGRLVRGHRAEQHHDLPQRRHAEQSHPGTTLVAFNVCRVQRSGL
jgi:hypothetical protein